ncbi:MAG: type IV secretion system protein VirB3 [Sphingomonas sp.]|uniref:type IV secretion system protein VirB3 n=1 Tax=unclassified Sphingomonas TaxID=196159 RepID=UPI00053D8619|nr:MULTISPECIES: type IV secretion system protein VirB3 [unclassified Sphingomonas]MDR6847833.1 type IV secretion system protein VirB3 [Sphingomonas sp. BE137]MDR7258487.1 type IV secretion system protein VirB3 [Sphingomonas sp. BE270]RUN78533.1 type VI secretion protein [Sphingomonas sp. TF3]
MNAPLARDPVFGALTRPQMFAGVTYSFFVLNAVITMEAFLVTKSFLVLLLSLVIHLGGYLACLREPRFFDLWMTKLAQCPRGRNHAYWRCNSYCP